MDTEQTAGSSISIGSMRDSYAHLLQGAGLQLEPASCVYLDGNSTPFPLLATLECVEILFEQHGFKPRVILVRENGNQSGRSRTMKWLRNLASNGDASSERLVSLQFFPHGRTTNEATWEPSIYFAIRQEGRQSQVFFSVNKTLDEAALRSRLKELAGRFEPCAAYAFYFPKRYSPHAYFTGIAAPPSGRREGTYSDRDSKRLVHWRDNTQIGILAGGVRRFYNVCDGYVRDAYPLMLLSDKHMARRVGKSTLAEAIEQQKLGSLAPEGEKFLWRIPAEKLAEAQKLLDDNDISLSGRRLE